MLVFTVGTAGASAQSLVRPLSLDTLAQDLNSPEAIARYMWKNFTYEYDRRQFGQEEYWQSPEEFLDHKKGDCEDFALFAHALLSENGYKSFVINLYAPKYAHTVVVFIEDGKYNAIDGTDLKNYQANSLEELFTELNPHWITGAIMTKSSRKSVGKVMKKFDRNASNSNLPLQIA